MSGHAKSAGRRKRDITNSKPDNPEQFKRFIEMAREVEVDESPDAVDRAFDKVMGRQPGKSNQPSLGRSRSRQKRYGERSQ
jgi:hypothetical protein